MMSGMKLDRNITTPRRGKYALIKLRSDNVTPSGKAMAIQRDTLLTIDPKAVDFGDTEDSDFFVIRLKDEYAAPALFAYANAALKDDPEYAGEVFKLTAIRLNESLIK